ncbi:myb-like protein X [Metopolophium dirhodum]|uniref:myb-like protein X n=1 Tax=Metopolophium dirhodum TaxID=44670 RepID=UPI00298FAF3C|nr:myb-like protein X [Metopolophium dirhodum]
MNLNNTTTNDSSIEPTTIANTTTTTTTTTTTIAVIPTVVNNNEFDKKQTLMNRIKKETEKLFEKDQRLHNHVKELVTLVKEFNRGHIPTNKISGNYVNIYAINDVMKSVSGQNIIPLEILIAGMYQYQTDDKLLNSVYGLNIDTRKWNNVKPDTLSDINFQSNNTTTSAEEITKHIITDFNDVKNKLDKFSAIASYANNTCSQLFGNKNNPPLPNTDLHSHQIQEISKKPSTIKIQTMDKAAVETLKNKIKQLEMEILGLKEKHSREQTEKNDLIRAITVDLDKNEKKYDNSELHMQERNRENLEKFAEELKVKKNEIQKLKDQLSDTRQSLDGCNKNRLEQKQMYSEKIQDLEKQIKELQNTNLQQTISELGDKIAKIYERPEFNQHIELIEKLINERDALQEKINNTNESMDLDQLDVNAVAHELSTFDSDMFNNISMSLPPVQHGSRRKNENKISLQKLIEDLMNQHQEYESYTKQIIIMLLNYIETDPNVSKVFEEPLKALYKARVALKKTHTRKFYLHNSDNSENDEDDADVDIESQQSEILQIENNTDRQQQGSSLQPQHIELSPTLSWPISVENDTNFNIADVAKTWKFNNDNDDQPMSDVSDLPSESSNVNDIAVETCKRKVGSDLCLDISENEQANHIPKMRSIVYNEKNNKKKSLITAEQEEKNKILKLWDNDYSNTDSDTNSSLSSISTNQSNLQRQSFKNIAMPAIIEETNFNDIPVKCFTNYDDFLNFVKLQTVAPPETEYPPVNNTWPFEYNNDALTYSDMFNNISMSLPPVQHGSRRKNENKISLQKLIEDLMNQHQEYESYTKQIIIMLLNYIETDPNVSKVFEEPLKALYKARVALKKTHTRVIGKLKFLQDDADVDIESQQSEILQIENNTDRQQQGSSLQPQHIELSPTLSWPISVENDTNFNIADVAKTWKFNNDSDDDDDIITVNNSNTENAQIAHRQHIESNLPLMPETTLLPISENRFENAISLFLNSDENIDDNINIQTESNNIIPSTIPLDTALLIPTEPSDLNLPILSDDDQPMSDVSDLPSESSNVNDIAVETCKRKVGSDLCLDISENEQANHIPKMRSIVYNEKNNKKKSLITAEQEEKNKILKLWDNDYSNTDSDTNSSLSSISTNQSNLQRQSFKNIAMPAIIEETNFNDIPVKCFTNYDDFLNFVKLQTVAPPETEYPPVNNTWPFEYNNDALTCNEKEQLCDLTMKDYINETSKEITSLNRLVSIFNVISHSWVYDDITALFIHTIAARIARHLKSHMLPEVFTQDLERMKVLKMQSTSFGNTKLGAKLIPTACEKAWKPLRFTMIITQGDEKGMAAKSKLLYLGYYSSMTTSLLTVAAMFYAIPNVNKIISCPAINE